VRSVEVQSIIAQYNQLAMKRARLTQSIKEFLRSNNTPANLERKILKWVSFDFEVKQQKEIEDMALSHVPAELRCAESAPDHPQRSPISPMKGPYITIKEGKEGREGKEP